MCLHVMLGDENKGWIDKSGAGTFQVRIGGNTVGIDHFGRGAQT